MGHFVTRFPSVSETFVVGDMTAMTSRWPEAHMFAFFKNPGPVPEWLAKVHYLPLWRPRLLSQLHFLFTKPVLYFKLLFKIIEGHWSNKKELLKVLATWPQMVHAARIVERENLEALHAHWSNMPATTTYVVASLLNKEFSCTGHAHDLFKFNAFLGHTLKKTKLFITSSRYARNRLLENHPWAPPEKIQVYSHGVDLKTFTAGQAPPPPPLVLVTVGRMTWQKGFPTLIKALGLIKKWNLSVRLDFLGLPGPTEGEVRRLIETLGVAHLINWLKPRPVEQMVKVYHQAHVFVLPCEIGPSGDRDGIPNVILEALATGLPCISTTVAGVPEGVIHEKNGLLVPPTDHEALAAAIRRVHDDENLRQQLALGARKHIEDHFDRVVCHKRIVELMTSAHG
jgi:glycosyltransferase involved in cell wall biosynthesis